MKIAIDIDDTLFQTHDLFFKFCNENGYNTDKLIENDKFKDYKVFMKVWYEFVKSKKHLEIPPIEDSIKIVNQLAKDNELYIITARDDSIRKETLELLEEMLVDYKGTLILISHDRTFLNNVVGSTVVMDGDGVINQYAGGYDDYLIQKQDQLLTKTKPNKKSNKNNSTPTPGVGVEKKK